MAFKKVGSLNTNGASRLETAIISNSATITIGDVVNTDADGFIQLATAGNRVLGIVVSLRDPATSAFPSIGTTDDTVAAAADNETVAKLEAVYDTSSQTIYSASLDATIGTTTGSDLSGYYADIPASSDTLDENTAATTAAQFFLRGPDPADTSRALCTIAEHAYVR